MIEAHPINVFEEVPLIGAGFHAFIDHLFWYLPFPSVKQGNSLLEEWEDLTKDDWSIEREEIRDEHKLECTPNDLIVSWKAWIRDHWPNKGGTSPSCRGAHVPSA